MNEQLNKICKIWFNLEDSYKNLSKGLSKTQFLKKIMSFDKIATPAANLKGIAKQNIAEDTQSIAAYEQLSLILENAEDLLRQGVDLDDSVNLDKLLRGELNLNETKIEDYNVSFEPTMQLTEVMKKGVFDGYISEDAPDKLIQCVSENFIYAKDMLQLTNLFKQIVSKIQHKQESEFERKVLALISSLVMLNEVQRSSFLICDSDSCKVTTNQIRVGDYDVKLANVKRNDVKLVPNGITTTDLDYWEGIYKSDNNNNETKIFIVEM